MGYRSRRGLSGADPGDAGEDGVLGVVGAEGLLVADAVLDDDESCLWRDEGSEKGRVLRGVEGFVGEDDVGEGFLGRGGGRREDCGG